MSGNIDTNTNKDTVKLEPREEILWWRKLESGWFKKHCTEFLMVTDHRIMKETPQTNSLYTLRLEDIDSIQVLDVQRSGNFNMNMVGVRGGQLRTGQYYGQSKSRNVGNILFMSRQYTDIVFTQIVDPSNLAKLVKSAKDLLEDEQREQNEELR
jgi:hypothetical protein